MRKIKFRAWDKKKKKMWEDIDLNHSAKYGFLMVDNDSFDEMGVSRELVLMQYTGLVDKNGKEIYEGDIVKGEVMFQGEPMEIKGQIKYVHCRFVILEHMCSLYQFSNKFDGKGRWIKVIGNKFENPELLEEVKK